MGRADRSVCQALIGVTDGVPQSLHPSGARVGVFWVGVGGGGVGWGGGMVLGGDGEGQAR